MSAQGIRAGRAFVELGLRSERFEAGLSKAASRLRNFGRATQQMGMGLTKMAATVAIPVALSSKVFMEFERQMAEVATMLDEPEKHMDSFQKAVRDMSVEFGQSTETIARGLYDILSASIAPADALKVLDQSARVAVAGLTEVGVAADAITTILNAFQIEASRASDVADFLFAVVKKGKTTMGLLAPNIGKVATFAAGAGLSLNEMGAAIASLTRNGLQTEVAITALRATISAIMKPQEKAAEAAHEMGIELNQTALQAMGLLEFLKQFKGVSPGDMGKMFPNIRALVGLGPLLQDMQGLQDDIGFMADRAGIAEAKFEDMSKTAKFAFDRAKQSVLELARSVGETLSVEMVSLFRTVIDVAGSLSNWAKKNGKLIITVTALAAALGTAGVALTALGFMITQVGVAVMGLSRALAALRIAMTFIAAHPIGAALSLIALGVAAVAIKFRALKQTAKELADEMSSVLSEADEMRRGDAWGIERLKELASQQSKTSAELVEAELIIESLTSKYGNLGITLDSTTGQISGMADAQERLNTAMRAQAIDQVQNEIRSLNAALKENAIDMGRDVAGRVNMASSGFGMARGLSTEIDSFDPPTEETRAIEREAQTIQAKLDVALARLALLQAGDTASVFGDATASATQGMGPGGEIGAADREAAMARKLAEMTKASDEAFEAMFEAEKEGDRRFGSDLQKRFDKINDYWDEVGATVENAWKAYEALLAEQGKVLSAQEELNKQDWQNWISQNRKKELGSEQAKENKIAAEKAAAAQKKIDDAKRRRDQTDADQKYKNERLRIKLQKKGAKEEALALLELEKKKALADAKASGSGQNLKLIQEEFALRKQLINQQKNIDSARTKGVFSGFNMFALQSSNTNNPALTQAKKTATATAAIAKNAKKQTASLNKIEQNTRSSMITTFN